MKSDFFEIKKNVSFENAYEFSKPDETVITRIRDLILGINIRNGRLRIENILKDRKLIKYLNVDDLLFEVKNSFLPGVSHRPTRKLSRPCLVVYSIVLLQPTLGILRSNKNKYGKN